MRAAHTLMIRCLLQRVLHRRAKKSTARVAIRDTRKSLARHSIAVAVDGPEKHGGLKGQEDIGHLAELRAQPVLERRNHYLLAASLDLRYQGYKILVAGNEK